MQSSLSHLKGQVGLLTVARNNRIPYQSIRLFASAQKFRQEADTFGPIQVPADRYWGAQTQRSLQNFKIGGERERMPLPVVKAFGLLKKSAAKANLNFGLEEQTAGAII